MAGFRELARAHNEQARRIQQLETSHNEACNMIARLIGAHNIFVKMPFKARLRWLLRGDPGL